MMLGCILYQRLSAHCICACARNSIVYQRSTALPMRLQFATSNIAGSWVGDVRSDGTVMLDCLLNQRLSAHCVFVFEVSAGARSEGANLAATCIFSAASRCIAGHGAGCGSPAIRWTYHSRACWIQLTDHIMAI